MSTGNRKPFYRLTAALPAYVFLSFWMAGRKANPVPLLFLRLSRSKIANAV